MLYFSGLQRENKSEINLAGIWLAYRLVVFGVAIGGSVSFLPTSLVRHPPPREPHPASPVIPPRLPRFANHAPPPGQSLPVCVVKRSGWTAGEQTCMRATDCLSVASRSRPRFALKKTHAARITPRGGGGAHGRALFSYNSSHPTRNFFAISPLASHHLA